MPDILTAATADQYAETLGGVIERVADRFARATQPFSGASRAELQALVDGVDLDAPGIGTPEALREIDELFLEHAVWFHDPAYLAHLNCPVAVPAVAAEAIVSAVNSSLDTYDQSAIGTLMERRLVEWTAGRIGFPDGDGVFTSGGTLSNLQALLLAREAALAAAQSEHGLSRAEALPRLVIAATEASHFSVQKSALLLGLADDSVELIDTDHRGRMEPRRARGIPRRPRRGRPHPDVRGRHRRHHRSWMHRPDRRHRRRVRPHAHLAARRRRVRVRPARLAHPTSPAGGHRARPLGHRRLPQELLPARVVERDHRARPERPRDDRLARRLPQPARERRAEPGRQVAADDATVRRAQALGDDPLGGRRRARRAIRPRCSTWPSRCTRALAASDDVELVAETDLSTVLFRYRPAGATDAECDTLVPLIRRVLFESGRAHLAKTVIDGRPCLKFTLLNPETTLDDVLAVVDARPAPRATPCATPSTSPTSSTSPTRGGRASEPRSTISSASASGRSTWASRASPSRSTSTRSSSTRPTRSAGTTA